VLNPNQTHTIGFGTWTTFGSRLLAFHNVIWQEDGSSSSSGCRKKWNGIEHKLAAVYIHTS